MGLIFILLGIGGIVTAIVGIASGPSWVVTVIGVAVAVLFFALARTQIRKSQGLGWMMRGAQSVGAGQVEIGIGQLGNAVSILRSRNQIGDLGVAELTLACALAVEGRTAEAREHFATAKGLLEDPRDGAYARRPNTRPQFEHMAQTLQAHLATGTPDRQGLHAILFS